MTNYKIADPRSLAKNLMDLDVFRENQLSLYCGVPASDLVPSDGSAPPPPGSGWFSCLVCQGDTVLLAANLPPEEWDQGGQADGVPGLLTLELPETDYAGMCQTVERTLKQLLGKERTYGYRFLGRPVPSSRLPELARAQLVEQSYDGDSQLHWVPTGYGTDSGLALGYAFWENGDLWVWPWCSEQTDVNLEKILAWEPAGAGTRLEAEIPFSQRIEQLNRGLYSDGVRSAQAIKRLANTPLDDYLKDFPEELDTLRRSLPMLGAAATYQDAAVLIYRLQQYYALWPKEFRDLPLMPEDGRILMECLALPLLDRLRKSR